jgi:hypothetical protein
LFGFIGFTSINIIMADQYTPEEIQGIVEAYNNAIKSGTPITQDMANAMKDAQKGVKGYAAAQASLYKALGKSVADITKAMYKGEQGAAGMADSIESVTTALTAFTFLLGGPLVKAISLVTMGLFKFGKVAAEQSDQLFKTYQELAKTGAGAADGMKGVFENMQRFGYGLEQLDQMTALIKENSEVLSTFGGTVLSGTKAFAGSMEQIQRSDIGRRFQQMGYTVDDINKYGAGYIKMQQMLGRSQSEIQKNLADGTVKYTMELDKLARITGDTREAQEAKIAEAQAEDTFAATMDELAEQAAAGDASAEARIKKLNTLNQTLTGEARQEFIKAIGGDVAAAQKLMMTAPRAYQMMLDSSSSAGDVMRTLVEEEKNTRTAFRGLYKLGAAGDTFIRYAEQQKRAAKFGEENLDAQIAIAESEQTVSDQTTKNAADMRINQQQARDALQSFVNIGVSPATTALKGFSSVVSGISKLAPGTVANGQAIGGGTANINSLINNLGTSKSLLDIIGQGESKGNYNALVYGKKGYNTPKEADLVNMTIAQVMEYQKGMIGKGHASTAVGKYQMIADTLADQVKKSGLDVNTTKFDQRTQDLLAQQLINQAGYGRLDPATVMKNLSGTWASLPKDMSGRGTWDNFNGNRAGINANQLMAAISGPNGGYDSKMSAVKPGSSLSTPDTTMASQPTTTTQSDELLDVLRNTLVSLDRKMADVADNTKKTAQYAGN